MHHQVFAVMRQAESARVPVQQTEFGMSFQSDDMAGDGGLTDALLPRYGRERPGIDDSDEAPQSNE